MIHTPALQPAESIQRFARYATYKNSSLDWLGEIPEAWEVKPLKHMTSFSTGWTPPTGREDFYGGEHRWANIGDLGDKVLYTTEKTITEAAIREARLAIVEAGSLLFSFKLSVGAVSIAGISMYTNEAIAAFSPSKRIDIGYLYWAAPVLLPRNAQENIYGAPLLNGERIANAHLLSPPLTEQRAIAAFLDGETAKMDALVVKKARLIELLQEERTALITRAVTQGLDPNVPMKDSGVEWLGQIPVGWEAKRLGQAMERVMDFRGRTPLKLGMDWGGEIPAISAVNVREGHLDLSRGVNYGSEALHDRWMTQGPTRRNDVLFTTEAPLGNVALVPDDKLYILSQRVVLLRPDSNRLTPEYLQRFLISFAFRQGIEAQATGSTAEGVKRRYLMAMSVCVPRVEEQRAIAAFLDLETARIDALITKVRDAIDRLRELRTALIVAAVTGKIDVREKAA